MSLGDFFEEVLGAVAIVAGIIIGGPWGAVLTITGSVLMGDVSKRKAERQAKEQWNAAQVDRMANTPSTTYDRELVLGRVRKGGHVFFRASTGTNQSKFVMCVALASHEIDAVEQVYLNDVAVTLDADGYVQTDPYLSTNKVSSTATIAAGQTSVTLPYTPVEGSVHATYRGTRSRGNGGDVPADIPLDSTVNGKTVTIAAWDVDVTISYQHTDGASYARVRSVLGNNDQSADARLIELFPNQWTTNHRARGVAYLIVELDYNETAFPSGIPLVTAVIRGAKVYDPRSGTTAWSENPALLARHLLTHPNFGRRNNISVSEDARISAAANACDVSHSYTYTDANGSTTTETRALYRAATVLPFGTTAQSALDDIVQAMAGAWAYAAGEFFMRAGVYTSPVLALTDADLAVASLDGNGGAINIATHKARNDKINVVTPTIYDSSQSYKQTALPPLKASALITRDGVELPLAITMAAVTYAAQAQHIAGVLIRDARDPLTVELPFKTSAYAVELFDTVTLTLDRFGWSAKTFTVLGRTWSGDGTIQLTLKETSSGIYAPDSSFQVAGYAPNTGLRSPWQIYPPIGVQAISSAAQQADGTITTRVTVSWTAIIDPAITDAGFVEVQWQAVNDSAWQSQVVSARETQVVLTNVTDGAAILVRARTRNSVAVSDWNTQIFHIVTGQTTSPPAINALAALGGLFQIALSWSTGNTTRLDLAYTEIWASTSNNRATATLLTVAPWPVSGYTHIGLQPGQTWYYWTRVIDTSGNSSFWYPAGNTAGIAAAPSSDPSALLAQLTQSLGMSQLAAELAAPITASPGALRANAIASLQSALSDYDLTSRMQWQETVTNATITTDPATGQIKLLATANVTTDVENRLTAVETVANADHGTLTNTVATIATVQGNLSTAQSQISQLQSSVSIGASQVYVDNSIANATGALNVTAAQAYSNLAHAEIQAALDMFSGQQGAQVLAANVAVALSTLQAHSDAISAEAISRSALVAVVAGQGAAITSESAARANADMAEASARTILESRVAMAEGNIAASTAAIANEAITRAEKDSAEASARQALNAQVNDPSTGLAATRATLVNDYSTKVDTNTAIGSASTTLTAAYKQADADTLASANAYTFSYTYAKASINAAIADSVAVVSARLDTGDYAAVKTQSSATASAVDGIKAQYLLQVDANGHVSAIKLSSGADGGALVFLADKLLIAKPDGSGTPVQMLVLGTVNGATALGLNGNMIIDGSIAADRINTRGLSIKDGSGKTILAAGTPLSSEYIDSSLVNAANTANDNANSALNSLANKLNKAGIDTMAGQVQLTSEYAFWFGDSGAAGGATGVYIGSSGLVSKKDGLIKFAIDNAGNASFAGELEAAKGTFSGSMTADAINAVNTINIAGQAVTVPASYTTTSTTAVSLSSSATPFDFYLDVGGAPIWIFLSGSAPYSSGGGSNSGWTAHAAVTIYVDGVATATSASYGPGGFAVSSLVNGGGNRHIQVIASIVIDSGLIGYASIPAGMTLFAIGVKR